MIVEKFGGTSVATGERMANVAHLVARSAQQTGATPVVVVSAMAGVTDRLRHAARTAASGDARTYGLIRDELQLRHDQAINDCVTDVDHARGLRAEVSALLQDFEHLCASIHTLGELTPRGMDAVSGLGERLSARLVAAALRSQGYSSQMVEATGLLVTNNHFGNATPLLEETTRRVKEVLLPLLERGTIPVVTGFIGATRDGATTTLGRGSSDLTAAILGRTLPADQVWIWTDVNGVMTADPNIVPDAATMPSISYSEVAELSFFGAKVLHPLSIQPLVDPGIPLRVLNSLNPDHPGTLITGAITNGMLIKGITAIRDLSIITVQGHGMQGVPGVAARVFSAVAHSGTSVLMITQSSSEQSICFVVHTQDAAAVAEQVEEDLAHEISRGQIDGVTVQDQVAIVAVVGAGMRGQPGIASQVFGALAEHNISVISIAQGSSEYNLSLVLSHGDVNNGVRAIHDRFGLGRSHGNSPREM
ncbi:MAG: aspartate kinase [Anaerolineae bacterium]|jgi:aspartokinase/homoserine dehydrogenase 1|nr:aspartate kinase [Chloroflexota bacterium]